MQTKLTSESLSVPRRSVRRRLSISVGSGSGSAVVAQLTDLHFGLVTSTRSIELMIRKAWQASPDALLLTGDFVCRGYRHLSVMERTLRGMPGPTFAVLGNHDHFVDAEAVTRSLRRAGVVVLNNERHVLDLGSTKLRLVGVDDPVTDHGCAATALAAGPADLALCHDPEYAPQLWKRGVPLVLAGHTHAGQFSIGGMMRRVQERLGRRFVGGLYETDAGAVYVNAGVGGSAVPLRTGRECWRELLVVELQGLGST